MHHRLRANKGSANSWLVVASWLGRSRSHEQLRSHRESIRLLLMAVMHARLWTRDLFMQCTYVRMYMAVMLLKNVDQSCRFTACGFLACGFLACRFSDGCWSFICHEDSVRFSTLKTNGWACDAFSAAKIKQLHVEPNCEHSTLLHRSSIHCTWRKTGWKWR